MFNIPMIISTLGFLVTVTGGFMLLSLPFGLYYEEGDFPSLFLSSMLTLVAGLVAWRFTKVKDKTLRKRDGYIVVSLGWVIMSLFGAMPYILSGAVDNYTDAFFETLSGFTTTGATIFTDIEALPNGILLWRSLTQWLGGMGIIVLAIAILPVLGIGGMQLFVAEVPGPIKDKIHPRVTETAKRLWYIYVCLTLACLGLYWAGGMSLFDALNHALTTLATGGFSTKNASMAHYDSIPFIQYVAIVFMFIGGVNYSLIYFFIKRKFKAIWGSDEFRWYSLTLLLVSIFVASILYFGETNYSSLEKSIRDSLFQVVSLVTTTGFVSADYTKWGTGAMIICFALMFSGASAGSTSGGIKIVRHVIIFKNTIMELGRLLHPRAIMNVRFNEKVVPDSILRNILVFICFYLLIFGFGTIVLSLMGLDFVTAMSASATSLGNVGPGLGEVGPIDNFSSIPSVGKWFLGFLMLVGRLELFTVLLLFSKYFWKEY